jgi:hypothetical protein
MGFLSSAVLIVTGLVPVLYFLALLAWQFSVAWQTKWVALPLTLAFSDHALLAAGKLAPVLPFIPEFPWKANPTVAAILDKVHVGLIPALVGLALIGLGLLGAYRRNLAERRRRQSEEDRSRRVQDYQRDGTDSIDGRREPFISSRRAA